MPLTLLAADPTWGETLGKLGTRLWALWPVWLPLLPGALAIYLLLPRPRSYPALWGGLFGVLALGLGGWLLTGLSAVAPETFLFYAFSALSVLAGTLLVTQRNPARAALSFALVILSTTGLFLILAAPFLMAATIIIYAGAIVVTFLFVIMLAQQEGLSDADARSREPALAVIAGFGLLAALLVVLKMGFGLEELDQLQARTASAAAQDSEKDMEDIIGTDATAEDYLFRRYKNYFRGRGWFDLSSQVENLELRFSFHLTPDEEQLLDEQRKTLRELEQLGNRARARAGSLPPPPDLPLSGMSGTPASTDPAEVRRDPATGLPQVPAENSAYLGRSLFTDYLLPVELGGLLLLVATIGAIAIAHRRGPASVPTPLGPNTIRA